MGLFTGKKQGKSLDRGPELVVSGQKLQAITVTCTKNGNVRSRELRRLTTGKRGTANREFGTACRQCGGGHRRNRPTGRCGGKRRRNGGYRTPVHFSLDIPPEWG
jgi:hypothetical protein